jgi:hypothetical protein
VSRANRSKRLWNEVRKRIVTDAHGREGIQYQTPESWLDLGASMSDEAADALVAYLREHGVKLWLHPDPNGTVRTRMVFEGIDSEDVSLEMLREFSKYARVLAKAVARSGEWNAPQPNPFGDQPLPPGGQWTWGDD